MLPRDPSVRPLSPDSVPSASPAAPLRILLTEDHLDTGRLLTRLLQAAGHQVVYAPDATQALSLAALGRFDLLVSDLSLPDFDGCELMRRLRVIDPHIAGICMSGYGAEQDIHRAREAGFTEHLTKPVELHNLHAAVARIGKLVEARRARGSAAE